MIGAVIFLGASSEKKIFSPLPTPPISQEGPSVVQEPIKETLSYSSIVLSTDTPGKEIVEAIGGYEYLAQVLSLNRIDDKHLQKGMQIIIPSSFDTPAALSAFPETIPELSAVPKILLIGQRVQEFGAYEYGTLVRFGGISTGKESTPTANKLYHTNWKGKEVISSVNDEWLLKWNFNIENIDGIGIHQYELPGYPASHSCVRLSEADAMWFYEWADQWKLTPDGQDVAEKGTPVIIFGEYDFDAPAPWKMLPENPDAIKISPQEIDLTSIL